MNREELRGLFKRLVRKHQLTMNDVAGDQYMYNLYAAAYWPEDYKSTKYSKKYVEQNTY